MKVQAFATVTVDHIILDLVRDDRLIAQITSNSMPVPRIYAGREHDGQPAIRDAPQHARAQFAFGQYWLSGHSLSCRRLIEFLLNAGL